MTNKFHPKYAALFKPSSTTFGYTSDDGKRDEVRALAQEMGVHYIRREQNVHAKAGNINHALDLTDGEFIIILDADHVPQRNFISRTIGYFADERMGFVQTPHSYYNFDNFMSKLTYRGGLYWEEGELFYNVIQPGKNRWNANVFCGSAAIFRRSALAEVGCIAVETITEDMHTGMRIHSKGWKSLFVNERLIAGQAAPELTTYHSQRLRWGTGNLSIFWHDNPLTMPGLTLAQRISYTSSMLGWTNSLVRIALYLTPIMMLFSGIAPVRAISPELVGITALYLLTCWASVIYVSDGYGWLVSIERAAMANFFTNLRSIWRAVTSFGRPQRFVVTSKRGRQASGVLPLVLPQIVIATTGVIGLIWSIFSIFYFRVSYNYFGLAVGGLLSAFYAVLAFDVIRRSLARWHVRRWTRWPCEAFAEFTLADNPDELFHASVFDISLEGCGLVAYRELAVGDHVVLQLSAPGRQIDHLKGIVRNATPILKGDATAYRVGLELNDVTSPQLEAIWSLGLDYGLAKQYKVFDAAIRTSVIPTALRRMWELPRGYKRAQYPIALTSQDDARSTNRTVTETLSRTTATVLMAARHEPGRQFDFSMDSPFGHIEGEAEVLKVQEDVIGAQPIYRHDLAIKRFGGVSRSFQNATVMARGRAAREGLWPMTRPEEQPVGRALAATLAPMLAVGAIAMVFFAYRFSDEILLHRLARGGNTTSEDLARFEALIARTKSDSDSVTIPQRRLLALAALKQGRTSDAVRISQNLPGWEFSNVDRFMDEGRTAEREQDYASAAQLYADALEELATDESTEWSSRDVRLAVARANVLAGRLDKAIEEFESLFEVNFGTPEERIEYAGVLAKNGDYELALEELAALDADIEVRYLQASIHAAAQDFEQAGAVYRDILAEDPTQRQAQESLADLAVADDDFKRAIEDYRRLLDDAPAADDMRRIRQKLAYALVWNKDHALALQEFTNLLTAQPSSQDLWSGFLDAAAGVTEPLTAEQLAILQAIDVRKIEDDRDVAERVAQVASVYLRGSQFQAAVELLDTALAELPASQVVRLMAARAYVQHQDLETASQHFAQYFEQGGDGDDVRIEYAGVLAKQGALAEAITQLETVTPSLESRSLAASIHEASGDFERAVQIYQDLMKDADLDDQAKQALRAKYAYTLVWSKQYPLALEQFTQLLAKQPGNTNLWSGFLDAMAGTETKLTDQQQTLLAMIDLDRFEDDRDPVERITQLAALYQRADNLAEAITLLDSKLIDLPESPQLRLAAARAHAADGDIETALRYFRLYFTESEGTSAERIEFAGLLLNAEMSELALAELAPIEDAPSARLLEASIHEGRKEFKEAVAVYRDLLAESSTLEPAQQREIQTRYAQALTWHEDYATALHEFTELIGESPDQHGLWGGFLDAATGTPDPLSKEQMEIVRRIDPTLIEDDRDVVARIVQLASLLLRDGDLAAALALLETAPMDSPCQPDVCLMTARVNVQAENLDAAINLFRRYLEEVPDADGVRIEFAGVLASNQEPQAALEQLAMVASSKQAREMKASIHESNLEFDEAADEYRRMLAELDDLPFEERDKYRVKLANVLLWAKDYSAALSEFTSFLSKKPDRVDLWSGFLDAAAGATEPLTAEQLATLQAIDVRKIEDDRDTAERIAQIASVYLRGDQIQSAVELLDAALAEMPTSSVVRLMAARAHVQNHDLETASLHFAEYFEQGGDEEDVRIEYAGVLSEQGALAEAFAQLETVTPSLESRSLAASLHEASGDFERAAQVYQELMKDTDLDEQARQELRAKYAYTLVWSKQYPLALEQFTQLLAKQPDNTGLWSGYLDAMAGAETELTDEQQTLLARIDLDQLDDDRDPVERITQLASLYLRADNLPEAIALLDNKLIDFPQSSSLRLAAARAHAAEGNLETALRYFRLYFTEAEGTNAERVEFAGLLLAAEMDDLALAELAPLEDDPSARLLAASIHESRQEFDEAVAIYRDLLAAAPTLEPAQQSVIRPRYAQALAWNKDYATALQEFTELIDESPDQHELWGGFLDAATGTSVPLSKEQMEIVRRIDPTLIDDDRHMVERIVQLGSLYLRDGDLAAALALLDTAPTDSPFFADILLMTARVYVQTENLDQAVILFRKYLEAVNDADDVRIEFAGVLASNQEPQAALEQLAMVAPSEGSRALSAAIHESAQEFEDAAKEYRLLLAEVPDLLPAEQDKYRVKMANVLVWAKDYDAALNEFVGLLALTPDRVELWSGFLDAAAGADRPLRGDELRLFGLLDVTRFPGGRPLEERILQIAGVWTRSGDVSAAIRLLASGLENNPNSKPLLSGMANTLHEDKRFAQADIYYQRLLDLEAPEPVDSNL